MATQAWRSMDDEKQRKAFDDMKADSRKAARETLGLIEKMKSAPRKKRARSASSVTPSHRPVRCRHSRLVSRWSGSFRFDSAA